MSAATEATLQDLLRISRDMAGTIAALAKKSGVTDAELIRLQGSFEDLNDTTGESKGFFETMGKAVKDTTIGIYNLGLTASREGGKAFKFYSTLSDLLPEGISKDLSKRTAALLNEYGENLKMYQELTAVGATFGGSLGQIAVTAGKAYMTLDQFSTIVKNNSEIFSLMGGNVQDGMNRFVSIQNQMLGRDSPYGRAMAGLGYNAEQTAQAIANYMRMQGTANKQELMNDKAVMEGTVQYAKNLDILTKITGKRAEQIEKEYRQIADEESFRQYMSTLRKEEADAVDMAIKNTQALYGKDVAMQLRTAIQTGITTPLTDGQINQYLLTAGASQKHVDQMLANVRAGKKAAEIQESTIDSVMNSGKEYAQISEQLRVILGINATLGSGLRAESANILGEVSRILASGAPDARKKIQDLLNQQVDQQKGSAVALEEANREVMALGAKIQELRTKVLDPVVDMMSRAAKNVTGGINEVLGSQFVTKLTDGIGDTIKSLNNLTKSEEFQNKLKNGIQTFYENIKKIFSADSILGAFSAIGNIGESMYNSLEGIWNSIAPSIVPIIGAIFIKIKNVSLDLIDSYLPLKNTLDEKIKVEKDNIEKYKKELDRTPASMLGMPSSGRRRSDWETKLKESEERIKSLESEKTERSMSFDEIINKLKQQYSKPPERTSAVSASNLVASSLESLNGSNMLTQTSPATQTQAAADIERLGLVNSTTLNNLNNNLQQLNNGMGTMVTLTRELVDTSNKTRTAINKLNNDGFGMASA